MQPFSQNTVSRPAAIPNPPRFPAPAGNHAQRRPPHWRSGATIAGAPHALRNGDRYRVEGGMAKMNSNGAGRLQADSGGALGKPGNDNGVSTGGSVDVRDASPNRARKRTAKIAGKWRTLNSKIDNECRSSPSREGDRDDDRRAPPINLMSVCNLFHPCALATGQTVHHK